MSFRMRLQQQMAQNRRTTNDSDDSEDERICEIDKRIAARKAAQLAEQKAANDPSQYVSNRAKMLKDQATNSPGDQSFYQHKYSLVLKNLAAQINVQVGK